ncbi:Extradiol ring-cleavage dioxygenase, class III enzyme, subunit B [Scheffersomyces coipomensis]|uniref:Extradiol ring-cleavage dioxygenase, class III enzyme, subunit B n=1 Tax=Scheffersomyces coipomensis TaxID=1788519 RepID=UPI00315D62C4
MSATAVSSTTSTVAKFIKNPNPFPTYFFSHGGPTFMYENDDFGNKGAYNMIKKLGTTIKTKWKPDYIIVVSAHWQASQSDLIEISVPEEKDQNINQLIYDFYGFPDYMYKEKFPTLNSKYVSEQIKNELIANGIKSKLTKRGGIDHGVWVPFKVAFSPYNLLTKTFQKAEDFDEDALDLPDTAIIQVSLPADDHDFEASYKLGQVLSKFSDQLLYDSEKDKYLTGLIVTSGMSVHNLRDLGKSFNQPGQTMPYAKPFNQLLTKTLTNSSTDLLTALNHLKTDAKARQLLFSSHPTLEHFVPVVVASGVNDNKQPIKELYNDEMLSLGWGVYQFGNDYVKSNI